MIRCFISKGDKGFDDLIGLICLEYNKKIVVYRNWYWLWYRIGYGKWRESRQYVKLRREN